MAEKQRLESTDPRSPDVRIQSEGSQPGTPDAAHEMTDARIGPLLKFVLWLSIAVGVVSVVVGVLFFRLKEREIDAEPPMHPLANEREIPPDPRLQTMSGVNAILDEPEPTDPVTDQGFAEHDAASRQRLSTYGWVDRATGVVRIPIEHAVEIALEKGFVTTPSETSTAPEKR